MIFYFGVKKDYLLYKVINLKRAFKKLNASKSSKKCPSKTSTEFASVWSRLNSKSGTKSKLDWF